MNVKKRTIWPLSLDFPHKNLTSVLSDNYNPDNNLYLSTWNYYYNNDTEKLS